MNRRFLLSAVLVVLLSAVWFAAGYLSGLAKGKGWRAAVIADGCQILCPLSSPINPKPAPKAYLNQDEEGSGALHAL